MCGRATFRGTWAELYALYAGLLPHEVGRNTRARYNIAPTQDMFFVHVDQDGEKVVSEGRWWLVPHWAKELQNKYPMFNARSEDAHNKPAFRDAYKTKRCLIPADGYYEWTKNADDGKKDPWLIELPESCFFFFAGLWTYNKALDVTSCTILTADADPNIAQIHHRMPVILEPSVHEDWIDPGTSVDVARDLLKSNLGADLIYYRVGRQVGNSRYDAPDCAEPLSETE